MSDVGSDEFLHVNDKYHFFLLNITKTWGTDAPKKYCNFTEETLFILPIKTERK